jgi:hypothetical protein
MSPRDLLRLIGLHPSTRTAAERDEDFDRYRAGWSMRRIAKARGIGRSTVQRDIHARLAHLVQRDSSEVARPTCNPSGAGPRGVADPSGPRFHAAGSPAAVATPRCSAQLGRRLPSNHS